LISEHVVSLYNELWDRLKDRIKEEDPNGHRLSWNDGARREVQLSEWSGEGNRTSRPVSYFTFNLDEQHVWVAQGGPVKFHFDVVAPREGEAYLVLKGKRISQDEGAICILNDLLKRSD
jgi:hypothetical protein